MKLQCDSCKTVFECPTCNSSEEEEIEEEEEEPNEDLFKFSSRVVPLTDDFSIDDDD